MWLLKVDPGPCPVDDCPHTTCVAPVDDAIAVVQLPARDRERTPRSAPDPPPLSAQSFTTKTYRGWPT